MKLVNLILILPFVFSEGFAALEPEYPFNLDVEALWVNRARTPSIGLVDYNDSFCSCECGGQDYSSKTLISDLDRSLAARITFNARNKFKSTLEVRGTTPFDFQSTKNINSPGSANVGCDLAYGYYYVTINSTPYIPIFNVNQYMKIEDVLINGVLVSEVVPYYQTDYIEADRIKVDYKNSYFTVEANSWNHMSPRWANYFSSSYGFGLRYFSILDFFKETFFKETNISFFDSHTKNRFFGAQILLDLHIHPYRWLDWGIRMDGGMFASYVRLNFQANDLNGESLLARFSKHRIDYGFFGDLEIFLAMKFLERGYILFNFGGTLIHGIAQAIANINLTTNDFRLHTNGNVVYQFWSIGTGFDF